MNPFPLPVSRRRMFAPATWAKRTQNLLDKGCLNYDLKLLFEVLAASPPGFHSSDWNTIVYKERSWKQSNSIGAFWVQPKLPGHWRRRSGSHVLPGLML